MSDENMLPGTATLGAAESGPVSAQRGRNRYSSSIGACHCGAEWPITTSVAHCGGCHRSFTGLSAFDKHRDGSHVTGRFCREPEAAGLVAAKRSYPCWGFPNDDGWAGPR